MLQQVEGSPLPFRYIQVQRETFKEGEKYPEHSPTPPKSISSDEAW